MADTESNQRPNAESNHRPRRPTTPLTKGEIDNKLKPKAATYRRADGQGLYLQIEPTGGKYWRMAYRFAGKQKTLSFGRWPDVDLIAARKKREAAKDELRAGRDPGATPPPPPEAPTTPKGPTFGEIAADVLAKLEAKLKEGRAAPRTIAKNRWLLEDLAAPLKDIPIADLQHDGPRILSLCERISDSGRRESAIRLRGAIGGVFKRAINTGKATANPTLAMAGELDQPDVTHHAGLTEPKAVGRLLLSIDSYSESRVVGLALKLAPYVFLRPGELRGARHEEVDLTEAVWVVPESRTKLRRPHVVPLAPQAVEIMEEIRRITGPTGFMFPSLRTPDKSISEGTLKAALANIGYTSDVQTPHGFRTTASTLLHRSRKWERHTVEFQLQHVPGNKVERAYDRNEWLEERVEMMTWWADQLDAMKRKAKQDRRIFA
jgi:integrase